MGCFGKCNCQCECLPVEDLPTVTIANHTGNGWTGTCCYQQTFTPNTTPSWGLSCSAMLFEASAVEKCITEHWRLLSPLYRGYEISPSTCEDIPENPFCPPDPGKEKIATTTTDWTWTDNAFMALWRRPKEIIVQISREDVNCDGVEGQTGGCKIVIRSRYVYEYATKIYGNANDTLDQTVTMHSGTCFEANPDAIVTSTTPTAFTCSDVPSTPPTSGDCRTFGEFYFDRVKYFDDMPTGSYQFTNSDVPGCTASTCNYDPYNYTGQVCIYSPSGDYLQQFCTYREPCYCLAPINQVSATINQDAISRTDEVPVISGCTGCGGPGIWICTTDLCDEVASVCPDTAYAMEKLGFEIDDDGIPVCLRPAVGSNGVRTSIVPACGWNRSIEGVGGVIPPYVKSHDPCTIESCDADCCEYIDDCPCCVNESCTPIYSNEYFSTVIEHTRSQTCSGVTQRSVCTNAPQWTITLA